MFGKNLQIITNQPVKKNNNIHILKVECRKKGINMKIMHKKCNAMLILQIEKYKQKERRKRIL